MARKKRRKSRTVNMRRNLIWLTGTVVVLFMVLIVRLAYISLIRHEYYSELATSQQLRDTTIFADRGTIYDANMNILARSATVWTVALDPNHTDEEDHDLAGITQLIDNRLVHVRVVAPQGIDSPEHTTGEQGKGGLVHVKGVLQCDQHIADHKDNYHCCDHY